MKDYDENDDIEERDDDDLDEDGKIDVFQLVSDMSKKSTDYEMDFDEFTKEDTDEPQEEAIIETKVLTAFNMDKELLKPENCRHEYMFTYNDDNSRVFKGYVVSKYEKEKYIFNATVNNEDKRLRGFTIAKIKLIN